MADNATCSTLVRGRALRATLVDACGAKVLGPKSQVVSKGFITVALTANIDEGTAINITNAGGEICVLDEPAPKFLNWTIEIALCGVNPDLVNLLANTPLVLNADADLAVGFRVDSATNSDAQGFALEVWTNTAGGACEGGLPTYGYMLIPFVKGGNLGDFTVANDAVNFTISNAKSKDGTQWGVGPYDVTLDETGVPGPLNEAVPTTNHLHMELVAVAPPTSACGSLPLGVPATSAIAGIPGTYSPANSYGRENLADMTGLTASPNTAWTSGQYVTMRDGNKAHWNATIWVAGPA